MTVHWKDDPNPLKQFCLVDVETASDPNWITVICENQTNLLKTFALCKKLLSPDIQIGFNDSQYDWPFIVEKAKKLGVLELMFNHMSIKPMSLEKITKWQYQCNMIKKFYPKAEKSSLTYYLRECNLDNKVDLPIHHMNKYYERALKETNATMAEQM
ncbi:6214_t:CDS:2, partial [Funneliformis geosporum]